MHLSHLAVKDDCLAIDPASTRRLNWPPCRVNAFDCPVVDETRCLGYHICCSGDTGRNKATMLGSLRGRLRQMDKKFALCSHRGRARWWKAQFRGVIGWHAAFIHLTVSLCLQLSSISNAGARRIAGLQSRMGGQTLIDHLTSEHNVRVRSFFFKTVVKWTGHCLRHPDHAVTRLMSFPLNGRLANL